MLFEIRKYPRFLHLSFYTFPVKVIELDYESVV